MVLDLVAPMLRQLVSGAGLLDPAGGEASTLILVHVEPNNSGKRSGWHGPTAVFRRRRPAAQYRRGARCDTIRRAKAELQKRYGSWDKAERPHCTALWRPVTRLSLHAARRGGDGVFEPRRGGRVG